MYIISPFYKMTLNINHAIIIPPAKKQMAEIQLDTASCMAPLIPCPLVHPSAHLEPKPRRMPLVNPIISRNIILSPR